MKTKIPIRHRKSTPSSWPTKPPNNNLLHLGARTVTFLTVFRKISGKSRRLVRARYIRDSRHWNITKFPPCKWTRENTCRIKFYFIWTFCFQRAMIFHAVRIWKLKQSNLQWPIVRAVKSRRNACQCHTIQWRRCQMLCSYACEQWRIGTFLALRSVCTTGPFYAHAIQLKFYLGITVMSNSEQNKCPNVADCT